MTGSGWLATTRVFAPSAGERGDHQDKNREKNPKNEPVQPFNVAGLRGGRVQDVVATGIESLSLRQQE